MCLCLVLVFGLKADHETERVQQNNKDSCMNEASETWLFCVFISADGL